jgi:16S rRNA (guanine527-N7)-methyltransferase
MLERLDPNGRLEKYWTGLMVENQAVNLVSRETSREDFNRLAAESLLPLEHLNLPPTGRYLDVGSGGGFPALPILLTRKVTRACLFERTGKKAAALARIISSLDLDVDLCQENFDEAEVQPIYDLATIRCVKLNLPLLKKMLLCLAAGGLFIYYSAPEFTLDLRRISVREYSYRSDPNAPTKSFTVFQKQK